jgi:transposase
MSSPSLIAVRDDSSMMNSSPGPRAGGPTPRRSFTPKQKLDHLAAYEDAISRNGGGSRSGGGCRITHQRTFRSTPPP